MAEIVIDERTRFGKPVIKGTRVSVDEVLGALAGGMTHQEIEKEYGVTEDGIKAALSARSSSIGNSPVQWLQLNSACPAGRPQRQQ
ncbi:DUF433 domain-containing protein [Candidatus Woesearchaeota archaeon]|nr:DUF433 domain-containing protein [Candidatus Woesearchaeota archaeon]